MKSTVYFEERQYLRQWWIWLFILFMNGFAWFGVWYQVVQGNPVGNKPMSDKGLLIITALFALFSMILLSIRLQTEIRPDGIYVRFHPIQRKYRKLAWQDISSLEIRKYKPLLEYGGWGWRFGLGGSGVAYNMSGNIGLQIVFKSGKRLLIGTQKAAEMNDTFSTLSEAVLKPNGITFSNSTAA